MRTKGNASKCIIIVVGSLMGFIKTITGVFVCHYCNLVLVLALLWKSIRTVAAFMFSDNGQS